MVLLGLALIVLGAIAILAVVYSSDPGQGGEILGFGVTTLESFVVGVATGAALLLGLSILKWGTRRSITHRRERKQLAERNAELERAQAEQRKGGGTGDAGAGDAGTSEPDAREADAREPGTRRPDTPGQT